MDIETFKAQFSDLLRPNRFKVEIIPPSELKKKQKITDTLLSCMAQETSFPFGKIVEKKKTRYGKTDTLITNWDYDPVNVTFLLESKGFLLEFLKAWKDITIDSDYRLSYYSEYVGEVVIYMLDVAENEVYSARLKNAYPVQVAEIPLSMESDNSVSKVTVTFTYNHIENDWNGQRIQDVVYSEPEKKNYDSFKTSDSIITFTPSFNQKYISENMEKLNKVLDNLNVTKNIPYVGKLEINLGSYLEKKAYEVTSKLQETIQTSINNKINNLQQSINEKYVQKQQEQFNKLTSSMQNKISKIFTF